MRAAWVVVVDSIERQKMSRTPTFISTFVFLLLDWVFNIISCLTHLPLYLRHHDGPQPDTGATINTFFFKLTFHWVICHSNEKSD